jgi:hypothetical protein
MPFFDWLKIVIVALALFLAFTLTLSGLMMVLMQVWSGR